MNRITRTALATALAVTTLGASFAMGSNAKVRFVHASPDAPPVDILVNGNAAFQGLAFGQVSEYATVPASQYDVQVVPAGQTTPVVIDAQDVSLFYATSYTVIALNTLSSIEPLVLVDEKRPAPRNAARVRFVHASPDAPAVDIAVAGGPILFSNVEFKGVGDYVAVPAGTYDLQVRLAGTETVVLPLSGVKVNGGITYTVYATGFAGSTPSLSAVVSVDRTSPAVAGRYDDDKKSR